MKNLIEELRACAKMHPLDIDLDVLLEAGDVIERQIQEIMSLGSKQKEFVIYTCIGKGGSYEYLGLSDGAGISKGEQREVYRCTSTGRIFHRECSDFKSRMEVLE